MMAALRAEFKKILTVRSTYLVVLACLLLALLFAFYGEGYKAEARSLASPDKLASEVGNAIMALAGIGGLVGVLLITHEYRYNTIVYSLTSSKSRSRILIAKAVVVTVFALIFSAFFGMLSPLLTYLGVHMHNLTLVHQNFNVSDLLWKAVFVGWGYMALFFGLASIIRNQVGAIATVLIGPGIVLSLLGLILKDNQVYLPFNTLNALFSQGSKAISVTSAVSLSLIYIAVTWLVAWLLFLRRDAA